MTTPQPAEGEPLVTSGLRLGYKLDDFQLIKTLGTGTFGRVYLSKLKDKDQYYAMKMLKKLEVIRLKQVEHINSERGILAEVKFPFVVNLLCTFQDERHVYMLLEYVVGGELFSHLRKAGRFSNEMTRFYASEITLAIEFLHNKNIIYRDLKPENLLLDHRGHIKITDFGFAKRVADMTWTLCGTPEYLAPEIIQSKGHGKPVDWWALGILIFEMLAGYPPFYDDNPFGIYEKILAAKVVFPSHFDENAKDLIKKLLTSDRTKRLGNLRSGSEDVKKHKWFKGVNFDAILARNIKPPIQPVCTHPGDTRNFEAYPEAGPEDESAASTASLEPYQKLFKVSLKETDILGLLKMSRQKGIFHRPFIYGSTAIPFTKRDVPADPSHTHKWSIYVRGVQGEDLSYLFKRVVIKIHESFASPSRTFDKPPYEVNESGWGEFQVTIKLTLHDPAEKVITLHHYLQLYTKEDLGNANAPKKTVISEIYDEIVFTDPIDTVYEALMANPVELPREKLIGSSFSISTEKEELNKLDNVYKNLVSEFDKVQKEFIKADNELAAYQERVRQLES